MASCEIKSGVCEKIALTNVYRYGRQVPCCNHCFEEVHRFDAIKQWPLGQQKVAREVMRELYMGIR
jgi:hypothetical protein